MPKILNNSKIKTKLKPDRRINHKTQHAKNKTIIKKRHQRKGYRNRNLENRDSRKNQLPNQKILNLIFFTF